MTLLARIADLGPFFAVQHLLWGVLGTVFAPLADRLFRTPVQVAA
ncbi:hypothetical protein ACQHIV_19415 [Kribbella sp. GL6]